VDGAAGDLTGPRHASVQRLRRLARQRRARDEERAFVLDSPLLLGEALEAGLRVDEVFAGPGADPALLARAGAAGAMVRSVADGVLAKATGTVTPQPVAAVAARHDVALGDAVAPLAGGATGPEPLALVLVGVGDPGNLGTLARSARATGAQALICCDGTVDPYNPKAVRASAGTLFGLTVVVGESFHTVLEALREQTVRAVGTVVDGGTAYDRADLGGPVAVVLGNEAHGLGVERSGQLDELVSIPMAGPTESLNVAMAGTVICFEVARQRRRRGDGAN
jgi:RNA methyltransferase, TrmH family